jgi:iron complex outermembrane receptor protein
VTGALSLFYTKYRDFVGEFGTGAFAGEEGEELPVFAFRATDAEFYGGELAVTIHLLEPVLAEAEGLSKDGKTVLEPGRSAQPHGLDLELKADYVRARDTVSGDPLPRIPPFRASAALAYSYGKFGARVEGQYVARQDRVSDNELPTDDHFLLGASATYQIASGPITWDAYIKGTNLTTEEARLHTSFLKDIAPLGGAGVLVGLKATF